LFRVATELLLLLGIALLWITGFLAGVFAALRLGTLRQCRLTFLQFAGAFDRLIEMGLHPLQGGGLAGLAAQVLLFLEKPFNLLLIFLEPLHFLPTLFRVGVLSEKEVQNVLRIGKPGVLLLCGFVQRGRVVEERDDFLEFVSQAKFTRTLKCAFEPRCVFRFGFGKLIAEAEDAVLEPLNDRGSSPVCWREEFRGGRWTGSCSWAMA
jgi:hypothetical protein